MKHIRYYLAALSVAALMAIASQAGAAVGWAGNVYPNNGASIVPTGNVTVYAQVWKGGVTDAPGQGADIAAELRYTTNIAGQVSVPMVYNTDVGNNDEYKGDVPQSALVGASTVDVTVVFTDLTDNATFEVTGDQNGHAPPIQYNVVSVLPNDVAVTFTMCMSGTVTNGAPCVIGSASEIGTWGNGVAMTNVSGELWNVTVTFHAGDNPAFEYKYKSDGCNNWEFVGNRAVALPTDGTTTVNLNPDSFNNAPLGCNLNQTLASDKTVCFQVCMDTGAPPSTGAICVIGSASQIGSWNTGVTMTQIGAGLYQACVVFPTGMPFQTVEYKFKKDDCNTWESVGNRLLTLDNSTPDSQTLTNAWENGTGACAPVPTRRGTWGRLKLMYR
jgi:hypothetical protein